MKHTIVLFLALAVGCGAKGEDKASGSASAAAKSSAADKHGSSSAKASASGAPSAAGSGSASAGDSGSTAVLGGSDWKAVFVGAPPMTLSTSLGGGQSTGMSDDYTRKNVITKKIEGWTGNDAGGGDIGWSPTKKAIAISNYNLKTDPGPKNIDTWIKSGLVKDVKHTAGPELLEVGPGKVLALAGAGTCTLKEGDPADFYWYDTYCAGDFAHDLVIVVVAKSAPEADKKAALSALRTVEQLEKCKPHYKK